MATVRELALRAISPLLGGADSPAKTVTRSQLNRYEVEDLPLYDFSPDEEKVEEAQDHDSVGRELTVKVRAIIDASAEVPVDDSGLDPLYAFAIQKLAGNDADLGGLVDDVEEVGSATAFQPAGRDVIGLEMTFVLKFATKRGDPTQRG